MRTKDRPNDKSTSGGLDRSRAESNAAWKDISPSRLLRDEWNVSGRVEEIDVEGSEGSNPCVGELLPERKSQDETASIQKGVNLTASLGVSFVPLVPYKTVTIDSNAIKEAIEGFIALSNAPTADIVKFASRWGMLGLCRHGKPSFHQGEFRCNDIQIELNEAGMWHIEDPKRWRYYASQLRALWRLAIAIERAPDGPKGHYYINCSPEIQAELITPGVPGEKSDWESILQELGPLGKGGFDWYGRALAAKALSRYLSHMLQECGLRPRVFWLPAERGGTAEWTLWDGNNLLPQIIGRMVLKIVGAQDYGICKGCEEPLFLRRGQIKGRDVYCKACGIRAAWRAARKRSYEKTEKPERQMGFGSKKKTATESLTIKRKKQTRSKGGK